MALNRLSNDPSNRNGYADLRRILPRLPHHSWEMSSRSPTRRSIPPQEAHELLKRFWESIDT